ncbi:hypothetical protein HGRIS_005992 [Hohenbuehelia grisea]|uniref:Uncharacterized protein n=1 Tax=Hohenbuehelia grisea TaxID=104357 RepID=A0ABR3JZF3_9AGAR
MIISEHQDQDLMQLWALIGELSEQLNQNRSLAVSLYAQANNVKSQSVHAQNGFVLRRFNMDKSQDAYDSELERMNIAISSENLGLQHDNKQLNALIKEFETTLETLMTNFRNKAQGVQERELSLIREYETKLLALEEDNVTQDLATTTAMSESLARLSHVLRQVLRLQGGEEPEPNPTGPTDTSAVSGPVPGPSTQPDPSTSAPGTENMEYFDEDREPWTSISAAGAGHALEREIELSRLEKENEELRRMLGLVPAYPLRRSLQLQHSDGDGSGSRGQTFEPPPRPMRVPNYVPLPSTQQQPPPQQQPQQQRLGGAPGTVGPYGAFKRTRPGGV